MNAAPPLSLLDAFEKACPIYLSYGMTYDQFWDGDISAHKAYREAEKMRTRKRNQEMWLQGMYIYEALIDVAQYNKAFSKAKPRPYLKEPYDLFEEDKRRREEEEARKRYDLMRNKIAAFAKAFNEKQKEEREVDSNAGSIP